MAKVESLMETQELNKKKNPKGSGIKALADEDENELQKTQQCRSIKQGASLQSAPMKTYYRKQDDKNLMQNEKYSK